jgi:hypothetical protein
VKKSLFGLRLKRGFAPKIKPLAVGQGFFGSHTKYRGYYKYIGVEERYVQKSVDIGQQQPEKQREFFPIRAFQK